MEFLKEATKKKLVASEKRALIILFGVLFFLVTHKIVDIFAFIVGFSIILLIVGFESMFPSQKTT
jgi:hypothetical protein